MRPHAPNKGPAPLPPELRRLYGPEDHPHDGRATTLVMWLILMIALCVASVAVLAYFARCWPWI